jgi:DNA excision repair protein ERCC-2
MNFSLENRTVSLSVGEFAGFSLGPSDSGGGPQGIWRAQLGQHWHNELQKRTLAESPAAQFEVVIDGRITHRGWTFALSGRIDQLLPESPLEEGGPPGRGVLLREIKSVMRPLPAEETDLRTDYPAYFLQLAAYTVLVRASASGSALPAPRSKLVRAELVFVEAGSGLAQTIALTPFDEALVHHQLDALVEFLNLRLRATERRRTLTFHPAFPSLRAGQ